MFLDAALNLTAFGFKVFPLSHGEKTPAISKRDGGKGCLDATDDENILASWAYRYPHANIGIATGRLSGCIVIDLDPRNGSEESVARFSGRKQTFLPTVTAKTANGGKHLYYAFEPALKNSKSALAPGIDIKTTGGYVVAPPSELLGGRKYTWARSPLGDQLPRLPRWVLEALKPKPQPVVVFNRDAAPKDIKPLVNFVAQAGEGQRNNSLFWAACRAAQAGQLDASAEASLIDAAITTGLDRVDAQKTIASARRKGRLS